MPGASSRSRTVTPFSVRARCAGRRCAGFSIPDAVTAGPTRVAGSRSGSAAHPRGAGRAAASQAASAPGRAQERTPAEWDLAVRLGRFRASHRQHASGASASHRSCTAAPQRATAPPTCLERKRVIALTTYDGYERQFYALRVDAERQEQSVYGQRVPTPNRSVARRLPALKMSGTQAELLRSRNPPG